MSDEKVVDLDAKRCKAYGICTGIAPDVFDIPPGSPIAIVLREVIEAEDEMDVEETVRACPAQAISIRSSAS